MRKSFPSRPEMLSLCRQAIFTKFIILALPKPLAKRGKEKKLFLFGRFLKNMAVEENRGKLKCKIQKEFKGFSNKGKRNFFKTIPIMKSSNWLPPPPLPPSGPRGKKAGPPGLFLG